MNILYICHEYPPCKQGGVGTFTKDIATYMAKRGHNVYVIGMYADNILKIENTTATMEDGVNVVRMPFVKKFTNPILNTLYSRYYFTRYVNKYIKNNNIEIVESPDHAGWLPCGVKGSKFVTRLHGCQGYHERVLKTKKSKVFKMFERSQLRKCKYIISVSEYVGKITSEVFLLKTDTQTIYNGIDIANIISFEKIEPEHYVFFFGTINNNKGVAELINAFTSISSDYPDVKLLLAGKIANNNYTNRVLDIAEQSNGRIKFLGVLDRYSELPNYIQNSLFCCFPSKAEAFSIAPLEAMMYEKPILISTACAAPELVDKGVDGVFCDPYSVESIKDGLITLLSDEVKRQEMGVAARNKVIEKFNNKSIMQQNEEYYLNLLKN